MPRARATSLLRALLVGIAVACSAPVAAADAAGGGNVAATQTALTASYRALNAIVSTWPAEEASFQRLDNQLAGECPDVGVGSPQNEPEQKLSYEVIGALWATGYRQNEQIVDAFIATTSSLRWSDPALTDRIHKLITGLREMIAEPVPALCTDVRAWAAGGFQTIPASTLQFDRHMEAINVEIPSPKPFARYADAADRGLIPRIEHLRGRFEELEIGTGLDYWDTLLATLGLHQ
jgi:hypothetical protein